MRCCADGYPCALRCFASFMTAGVHGRLSIPFVPQYSGNSLAGRLGRGRLRGYGVIFRCTYYYRAMLPSCRRACTCLLPLKVQVHCGLLSSSLRGAPPCSWLMHPRSLSSPQHVAWRSSCYATRPKPEASWADLDERPALTRCIQMLPNPEAELPNLEPCAIETNVTAHTVACPCGRKVITVIERSFSHLSYCVL